MTAADALRRLLADVRASKACQFERGMCMPHVFCRRPLRDDLDYLERLALDGLAGEAGKAEPPADFMFACSFCGTREGATAGDGQSIASKLTIGPGVSICPSCAAMAAEFMTKPA